MAAVRRIGDGEDLDCLVLAKPLQTSDVIGAESTNPDKT
jgi:hypothetical protein